jgi:hypothetical protein
LEASRMSSWWSRLFSQWTENPSQITDKISEAFSWKVIDTSCWWCGTRTYFTQNHEISPDDKTKRRCKQKLSVTSENIFLLAKDTL